VRLCPACGEENPDRFRLCGSCGTQLVDSGPAEQNRKTVTVVFCDLVGSTSLAERLDAESLREVLAHYFTEMQAVLERHGGRVEKYIGDAIVAVFGLPRAHEDDALRAVRAAAEMQTSLTRVNEELDQRWGVRLANRTGVNTGEVVAGDITPGQRIVTGDMVNVAARLEQAAPELEVLLGGSTYRLVRDAVEVEVLDPLELKGKAERVPAFRLVSVRSSEALTRRTDTPLVGRAEELGRLCEWLGRAQERRSGHLVTLVGEAGVGKSRLIHEFVTKTCREATVLRGRCLPYGEGITFWPLAEVVRQAAGIHQHESPDEARAKLAALTGDGEGAVIERVAAAIGLSAASFPIAETFWAVRSLMERLGRERPLVVVIDDIHWAESTFLDLLTHLASSLQGTALLLLCTSRRDLIEERPEWSKAKSNAETIFLGPLSKDESSQIAMNLFGDIELPEKLKARIVDAAGGNALFIEQMLSMLVDDGVVRMEGGRLIASSAAALFEVPPSILALLSARLDRLSSEERSAVDRGAVIGQIFYRGAVAALSPERLRHQVDPSLEALARKELIAVQPSDFAGDDAFRFHHILIRDAAYQGLLKRTRIELHEAYAAWLEEAAGNLLEFEEVRGYHLEQAYRYRAELGTPDEEARQVGDRAARLLSAAGRRAFAQGDMPAAASLLGRAASLLPSQDPTRLALLPDLGEALSDLGEFARANELVEEAIQGAAAMDDLRLGMDALVVKFLIRSSLEEGAWAEEILRETERAIFVLETANDARALARAWRLVGFVHATAGNYGAAEEALRGAIELARSIGDRREETRNLSIYAACALYGPMPVPDAIRHCEDLLQSTTGNQRSEATIGLYLSQLYAMRGDLERARALYRGSRASLVEQGEAVLAAFTASNSARVEMMAGDPSAAEEELRRDYEALQQMGEKYFLSTLAGLLAHALVLTNMLDEAEAFTRIGEETAGDDVESQSLWRRARAKVLARWGRSEEAEGLAREACALIEGVDSPSTLGNSLLDLAEVLALGGKPDEAVPLVREAVVLHEKKGNLVTVERARDMLDGLAEPSPGAMVGS
jgi:class 3 adenylate cyclase/tetratricopeptide (TPR) repeat protein